MSLLDVVRSGVKVADKVTRPLQANVKYERCLSKEAGDLFNAGEDGTGTRTFAEPAYLLAVVDYTSRMVRTKEGILTPARSTVTFLNAQAVSAASKGLGVRTKDRVTLPNGETGPILDIIGFLDPGTLEPVATTVMLG